MTYLACDTVVLVALAHQAAHAGRVQNVSHTLAQQLLAPRVAGVHLHHVVAELLGHQVAGGGLPTPGGPDSRAHLAQAPLSLAIPQGAGLEAPFFPPVFRWFLFQSRSQFLNLFMLLLSPCWPMMPLQLAGLYFSTKSSVSPDPDPGPEAITDFFSSGSIFLI